MAAPLYIIINAKLRGTVSHTVATVEAQFSAYPLLLADLGPSSLTEYLMTVTILLIAGPGSVTVRVRQDNETTGTILHSFTTSVIGSPVSSTALIAKPASTARLFLTSQALATGNQIGMVMFSLQRP